MTMQLSAPQARMRTLMLDAITGHYRTVMPMLQSRLGPQGPDAGLPFQAEVLDPVLGTVRLTGLLQEPPQADTLIVILHGSGGDASKPYCRACARAAEAAGFASLRLSMRGADHSGEDIYHAGLSSDVGAVLKTPRLERYRRVFLLGFSLGGHIALHAALAGVDPRLRAVAAISPPLDVAAAVDALDAPARWIYRRYIFAGLNRAYAAVAARRAVHAPLVRVASARTWRTRDALTIVPRFGFDSVRHYYQSVSVGPELHRLSVPTLIVAATHDPITPAETLRNSLERASHALQTAWIEGAGHMCLQRSLDLGQQAPLGLGPQVVRWLGGH